MYYSNPVIYNKYFDIFDNSNGDHQQKLNAATAPGEDSENPIKTEYQDFPVFPLYSQLIQPVQQQLQTPQYQTLQQQFPQTYSSNQDFFFNNSTMFGATNINANPNANANVSVVVPPPATAAVAAPDLNPFHSLPVSYPTLNLQPPLLQQYRQESVPIQYGQYEYNKKLSSRLSTTSFDSSGSNNSSYSSKSTYESDSDEPTPQYYPGGKKRYRVIRGMSAGGCATRPPKMLFQAIISTFQLN